MILLDTNAVRGDARETKPHFRLVQAVARRWQVLVRIPELAVEEYVGQRIRDLDTSGKRALPPWVAGLKIRSSDRGAYLAGCNEAAPSIDQIEEVLRRGLNTKFGPPVPTPVGAADKAQRREIRRQAPADNKGGNGRDVTMLETAIHQAEDDKGHVTFFVSNDKKAFFTDTALREELVARTDDRLVIVPNLNTLLNILGDLDSTTWNSDDEHCRGLRRRLCGHDSILDSCRAMTKMLATSTNPSACSGLRS
ncbi:PIN domain-containing protein [Salininema proteolyticum]|uniref:PIN domain-containing protein n=1 Tax=Salininema proteolyticum TaxID=1607685 RepID=A0ABV8U4B1_9ACTN